VGNSRTNSPVSSVNNYGGKKEERREKL